MFVTTFFSKVLFYFTDKFSVSIKSLVLHIKRKCVIFILHSSKEGVLRIFPCGLKQGLWKATYVILPSFLPFFESHSFLCWHNSHKQSAEFKFKTEISNFLPLSLMVHPLGFECVCLKIELKHNHKWSQVIKTVPKILHSKRADPFIRFSPNYLSVWGSVPMQIPGKNIHKHHFPSLSCLFSQTGWEEHKRELFIEELKQKQCHIRI